MRIAACIGARQADHFEQVSDALLDGRLVGAQVQLADRFRDDVANTPARIERGVGVLEDHLHPRRPERAVGAA